MAIIKSEQFESFFIKPPRGVMFYLLHGSEGEMVSERARRLAARLVDDASDPFQTVRLTADALAKDPGLVADEAFAVSMFGGRRVIWIEAGGRDIMDSLAAVTEKPPQDTSILVEAEGARKGSAMRTLFETRPDAVAIECFPAPPKSVSELIEAEARAAGIELATHVREELTLWLAGEPAAARTELAKLMLYAKSAGRLELDDLAAVLPDGAHADLDAAVDAALSGDLVALERQAARGLADPSDAGLAATRLAQRLQLLFEISRGSGHERLQRLPFSVRRAIEAQAAVWRENEIARRWPSVLRLLTGARLQPDLAPAAVFRALASIAMAARRGARTS